MEKLKTATGKTFDCDYFNLTEPTNRLSLQVYGLPFAKAAAIFSDPAETCQLWCEQTYAASYTEVVSMAPVGNSVRVMLRRK